MQRLAAIVFTLALSVFLINTGYASIKVPTAKIPAGISKIAVKKTPAILRTDTSKIQVKKFDANALNKFRADKDFNYNNAGVGEPSFWDRFWDWLWNVLFGWLNHSKYGGTVIEYVFLGASMLFLVYVISKSLGLDPIGLWRGDAKKADMAYSESLENIHEINFDAEIEKAIAQSNYRLAVRLLYLKCLKQLSDTRLIQWQIDKTNAAYISELADPSQKQSFGIITRQFEYVWYGNFAIDKQAFGNISQLFQNFKKQLP